MLDLASRRQICESDIVAAAEVGMVSAVSPVDLVDDSSAQTSLRDLQLAVAPFELADMVS